MNKVEDKIISIIAQVLGVSNNEVQEETSIGDLPTWDSLNHLQIIAKIEKEFGIKFTPDVMIELEDVSDIVTATKERIK